MDDSRNFSKNAEECKEDDCGNQKPDQNERSAPKSKQNK